MEKDDSHNDIKQEEEVIFSLKLETNNLSTKKKHLNSKKHKKQIGKIFEQNLDTFKFEKNNLSGFSDENSYYKFVGKSIFLFMNSNNDPLIIIGPDWPFVAFLFSIFNFFYILIIIKFWFRFSLYRKCINQIGYWSFILSFLYTSLINQGYPKNNKRKKNVYSEEEYYYCGLCKFYVDRFISSFHCNKCGICIEGQEHHCIWIGKCVGKGNIISFYIFIISTVFSLFYIIFSIQKIF